MKFRRIACAGFRGVRDSLEVEVPSGFLIVSGRNGAGKSTLCDIVEYALTGELRRHESDTERQERIGDYVWWRGDAKATERFVSVTLLAPDGAEVEIRRTPRGLQSPNTQEALYGLLCDSDRSPEDPIRLLLQTAIIRDEEITRLSIDLPETQRFQFVRAAVGEADLSAYTEPLSAVCGDLKQTVDQHEREYARYRETVSSLLESLTTKRAEVASEEDVAAAEAVLRHESARDLKPQELLRHARTELVDRRQRISQLEEFNERLVNLEREESFLNSAAYQAESADLTDAVKAAKEELEAARSAREVAKDRLSAIADRRTEATSWAQLLHHGQNVGLQNGHCPLCGSSLTRTSFEAHLAELEARVRETDRAAAEATRLEAETADREARALRQHQEAVDALAEHERQAVRASERRASLLDELARLNAEVETSAELQVLLESATSDIRSTERAILVVESSTGVEEIGGLEAELAEARSAADTAQVRAGQASRALERAKQSLDSLRRIEGEIIEERLSALGPLLEELYLRLRPHLDWTRVRYHIRGDVRRFLSIQIGEELNPRFMFSSGQRRALGIAFLLAAHLSTDWTRLQALLLDDPVQHIDDFRALHLVELFTALRAADRQIICTAEDPDLAELMVRRLRGLGGELGALVSLEYVPGSGTRVDDYRLVRPVENRVMESA